MCLETPVTSRADGMKREIFPQVGHSRICLPVLGMLPRRTVSAVSLMLAVRHCTYRYA